jgi:hypothetical protein
MRQPMSVWDKILTIEPGTENNYLPALRIANKRKHPLKYTFRVLDKSWIFDP